MVKTAIKAQRVKEKERFYWISVKEWGPRTGYKGSVPPRSPPLGKTGP